MEFTGKRDPENMIHLFTYSKMHVTTDFRLYFFLYHAAFYEVIKAWEAYMITPEDPSVYR